jgi:carboxymethylenebutenolidase
MNTTRLAAVGVAVGLVLLIVIVSSGPLRRMSEGYAEQLDVAPTHGEWVEYTGAGGDTVTAYIAFPERPDPAPAMIVIHEIYGLTDWVRSVADDFAGRGYVAISPDMLSRRGGTPESADDARGLIRSLPPDSITADLDATFAYLRSLRSVRGDAIGVIGFCWGGSQSFRYATNNPDLGAAVVCYGGSPDLTTLGAISAPVLGVYAENDARINANLPEVEAAMAEAVKSYAYTIYPGAGHAFLRRGEPAQQITRAWADVFRFLGETIGN